MPANVEKGPALAIDKYSYEGFTARTDSTSYVVMVGTSTEKINVNNLSDYRVAINSMAEGARDGAEQKGWTTTMTDVECDSIPGIKMNYTGKFSGRNTIGVNYFFLVNGLSYTIGVVFVKDQLSAKDSSGIDRFISSIDFPNDTREMQFGSRTEYIGYSIGRLTQVAIIILIIVAVVGYVIRHI